MSDWGSEGNFKNDMWRGIGHRKGENYGNAPRWFLVLARGREKEEWVRF